MNSKSLEIIYEDVLYFYLQPHPMACILGSAVMEWKQILQGSYIWKMNTFWWLNDVTEFFMILIMKVCDLDLKVCEEVGCGDGTA